MAQHGGALRKSKGEKARKRGGAGAGAGDGKKAKAKTGGINVKKKHGKGAITKKGHFDVTQKKRVPQHAKEDKMLTALLNKRNEGEAARLAAQGGVPLALLERRGETGDDAGSKRKEVLSKVKGRLRKLM